MRIHRRLLLILLTIVACDRAPEPDPSQPALDTMTTAMRDALDQFRSTVRGEPPTTIAGGATSRDELVASFADAVERADTAALIEMTMNRAEFAYLYYPHTIYTRPPYELDAETSWLLSKANTEKGLTRILERFGGKPFSVFAHQCEAEVAHEGPNRYWHRCTLTGRIEGAPPTMRWFGSIWERNGQFKFVSYANDL